MDWETLLSRLNGKSEGVEEVEGEYLREVLGSAAPTQQAGINPEEAMAQEEQQRLQQIEGKQQFQKETKEVLNRLKQIQSLEKIAGDEKAPQSASAAQMLIESLKKPAKADLSPLFALASPEVGKRLMQSAQMQGAFSDDEKRLAKAAEIEQAEAKLHAKTLAGLGVSDQDIKAIEKVGSMAEGMGRGSTKLRKAWENIASTDKLKSMVEDFKAGRLTFDKQSVTEYSNAVSALITNRAPGIETIRETAYTNFGGDVRAMIQHYTGNPQEYLSSKMAEEVERQVYNIEKSEKHKVSKTLARMFNAYRHRFAKSPEDVKLWQEQYGHFIDIDPQNVSAKPKDYYTEIETRQGINKQAPHGMRVTQGGVTFKWNGSEYVEE